MCQMTVTFFSLSVSKRSYSIDGSQQATFTFLFDFLFLFIYLFIDFIFFKKVIRFHIHFFLIVLEYFELRVEDMACAT